jgi:streptogrisin D
MSAAVSAVVAVAAAATALGTSTAGAGQYQVPDPGGHLDGAHVSGLRSVLPVPVRHLVSDLDALPAVPNTAWGVNPRTGSVTMTVADAAPSGALSRLLGAARRLAPDVQVEHVPGAFRAQVADGEGISHSGLFSAVLCTAGFNVRLDGDPYVITAGHCTKGDPQWDGLGPSVDSTFPGHDYGLIRNTSGSANGAVVLASGETRAITSAGASSVGEHVCKSGQSTGVTCGTVTGLGETVTYADGSTVRGLIATDLHAGDGDSGSPLFHGNTGLGTLSGGNGKVEYFQPLPAALKAYDATLAPARPASGSPAAELPPAGSPSPAGASSRPVHSGSPDLLTALLGLGSAS